MILKKLIKAHKNAFLSQENDKYFFDVKFKLSNGKFIYANKFFLLSISPEFQSLINSDEPIDAPTQLLFKNGPQTFLEQCYGDCVIWDSDSKSFVQLNEDSEKAKENYEIAAKKRYDLFMAQDKENGYFDVAFKFKDQKILYAHKFMLTCLSSVFQAMFTKNWDKEASIDIKFNTFDEFKTILKFFYHGEFNFKQGETLLLDFAECYNVTLLKDEIHSNIPIAVEMFFEYYNLSKLYNFNIDDRFKKLTLEILKSDNFLNAKKDFILFLVKCGWLNVTEEKLFEYILLWAKNQCHNFETISEMHEEMRDLLLEIFPYIRFAIMDIKYIYQIFCDYDLLFTPEERNDIIRDICDLKSINNSGSRENRLIQIKDKNGNYLFNQIIYEDLMKEIGEKNQIICKSLIKEISELCNIESIKTDDGIYWKHKKMLSINYKMDQCYAFSDHAYILLINKNGVLCLKDGFKDFSDFVVATFEKSSKFIFDEGCILRLF